MPETSKTSQLFQIQPSRSARNLMRLLHSLAFIACWLNSLPVQFRLILSLLVVSLFVLRNRYWHESVTQLRYTSSHNWEISSGQDADFATVTILNSSTITDRAILLNYKTTSQSSKALLITKDSMAVDSYRCLKVRLILSEYPSS